MGVSINEVDKVEILTIQDNYIDIASRDNTEVVLRAIPLKDMQLKNSILAEHGFSAVVTVTKAGGSRSVLFDFGFSEMGAAFNANALGVDLKSIESTALSHGHMDHFGGMVELMKGVGKKLDLVLHPEAFRQPRYVKITEDFKVFMPPLKKEMIDKAGLVVKETKEPYPLVGGDIIFLGQIPRVTEYEKGMASMHYEDGGVEKWDDIIDDTALCMNVKGKGLVIVSGCAHSGIVNTVNYAKEITGVNKIFAIMGGFHLTGAEMEPAVEPTIKGLMGFDPTYVIPTHCTGRSSTMKIEAAMPDKFIVNMAGTKLTFPA